MTNKTKNANLGDIIRAEEFAFGYYDNDFDRRGELKLIKKLITVDGKTKSQPMQYRKPGTPWNKPAEYKTIELGAYDKSRGKALFIVEKAQMDGGGTGHGPYDTYPDGWYVEARRLNSDKSYNPEGEVIKFYQSGCFTCMVPKVDLVGKMKLDWKEEN